MMGKPHAYRHFYEVCVFLLLLQWGGRVPASWRIVRRLLGVHAKPLVVLLFLSSKQPLSPKEWLVCM